MKKAQGLLETIVAIGVITTGLISVIALVISNLTNERETALRYQAINLAREGVELVRNIRDSNWLNGQDVWQGIGATSERQEMFLEYNPAGVTEVSLNSLGSAQIFKRASDGVYVQGSAGAGEQGTPFSRILTLQLLDCADDTVACGDIFNEDRRNAIALQVTSEVSWRSGSGREDAVAITETLYDWR